MIIPKHNKLFHYEKLKSNTTNTGIRHYINPETNMPLPSVTTILSETDDKGFLDVWKDRIGEKKAKEITQLSGNVGSHIHNYLEEYLKGNPIQISGNYARQTGAKIATIIANKGLKNVSEYWGSEVNLYFDNLYAGTTDLVGLYNGIPSIIDFKNTRKPKKVEYIENYKCQLAAYGLAHNNMYGTDIRQGVVLMVSREQPHFGTFQEFIINDEEWNDYTYHWYNRLEEYTIKVLSREIVGV